MKKLLILCIVVLFVGCAGEPKMANKKRITVVSGGVLDRFWETNNEVFYANGRVHFHDENGKNVYISANYIIEDL